MQRQTVIILQQDNKAEIVDLLIDLICKGDVDGYLQKIQQVQQEDVENPQGETKW